MWHDNKWYTTKDPTMNISAFSIVAFFLITSVIVLVRILWGIERDREFHCELVVVATGETALATGAILYVMSGLYIVYHIVCAVYQYVINFPP